MIKLEQYRDTWLSEKMDEVIGFYPRVVTIDTPISAPYSIDKTTFY